jgi:histidinol phosphatase-like enzyme
MAAERFAIDLGASYVIGDKLSDVGFGNRLGARPCLVRTGFGSAAEASIAAPGRRDIHIADNVLEAVGWAVQEGSPRR